MSDQRDTSPNIAVFMDFENVALGVRDAKYADFDVHLVLERLLDKGKVVVKKAYSDWERYKSARRPLHESAFELIEIPHVSYSGKNSADIRLVVDALDLCYTKEQIDIFVIVSGDSDFSPLVSKLRENAKLVIGLGVRNSTSDLLVENCDEFIYYDDLVRAKGGKKAKQAKKKAEAKTKAEAKPKKGEAAKAEAGKGPGEKADALELVLDTVESLFSDREGSLWASMVKQTLKRKRPGFSETYYGYRSFNELIEDADKKGFLEIQKDERSGGYLITAFGPKA